MLTLFGFLLLSLAALSWHDAVSPRLVRFFTLLYLANTGLFMLPAASNETAIFILTTQAIGVFYFLISSSFGDRLKGRFISLALVLLGTGILIFSFRHLQLEFANETYPILNKFLLTALCIVLLSPLSVGFKLNLLDKWIGGFTNSQWSSLFQFFSLGVAIFLASFGSGTIGILVVAMLYLISSFLRDNRDEYLVLVPLVFIWVNRVLEPLSDRSIYLHADVLGSIILGAFFGFFGAHILASPIKKWVRILMLTGVTSLIAFGMVSLGGQYELLGGRDALVALLIGSVLTMGWTNNGIAVMGVSGIMLFFGMLGTTTLSTETEVPTAIKVEENITKGVSPERYLSLDSLRGTYKVLPDSSQIDFRVGPKLQTKGAIRKPTGEFHFLNGLPSHFSIEMNVDQLTTFNRMRDEELMGSAYFQQDRFPKMRLKGAVATKLSENTYEISGDFTMMGVTNQEKVQLRRLDAERLILIGSGQIDRTRYGMSANSSEGNVVEFTYRILLLAQP